VIGTHQTVIQSLGTFYRNIEVVSGATIMGDGRVALIIDVAGLVRNSTRISDSHTSCTADDQWTDAAIEPALAALKL
jgi:chemotaxis protein histidine kinase CheA